MDAHQSHEWILVLDFGGQYNQLIARRIRDLGVYSELWPYDTPIERIKEARPKGIIFSGGPYRFLDKSSHVPIPVARTDLKEEILKNRIPMLRMLYFRMELHPIKISLRIAHRRDGRNGGGSNPPKSRRRANHLIAMTHPYLLLFG